MRVDLKQHQNASVLSLSGAVTKGDIESLEEHFERCFSHSHIRVIIEFRDVPFVDSIGLEKLQAFAHEAGKRGGDIRISSLNDVCADIFRATRVDSFIQTFPDLDSALKSLQ